MYRKSPRITSFFSLQPLLPLTHTSRHAHDQSLSYTQYMNTRIFPVVRGVEGQAGNFRTPPPEEIERKGIVKGKGGRASEKEEICVEPHHFLVIVLGLLE